MTLGSSRFATFGQLGVVTGGLLQRLRALRAETTSGSPFVKAATAAGGVFRARAAVRDIEDR